jgi:hypothetical protein
MYLFDIWSYMYLCTHLIWKNLWWKHLIERMISHCSQPFPITIKIVLMRNIAECRNIMLQLFDQNIHISSWTRETIKIADFWYLFLIGGKLFFSSGHLQLNFAPNMYFKCHAFELSIYFLRSRCEILFLEIQTTFDSMLFLKYLPLSKDKLYPKAIRKTS